MLISKAYTYIEMVFVLGIVSLLLFIQIKYINSNDFYRNSSNHSINSLIMQFNYLKSKAIKDNKPITLIFNTFSSEIIVREPMFENPPLKLPQDTFIHPRTNVNYLTFNKNGDTNKFGTLYITNNKTIYKVIFHIEKGRMRYEKM